MRVASEKIKVICFVFYLFRKLNAEDQPPIPSEKMTSSLDNIQKYIFTFKIHVFLLCTSSMQVGHI